MRPKFKVLRWRDRFVRVFSFKNTKNYLFHAKCSLYYDLSRWQLFSTVRFTERQLPALEHNVNKGIHSDFLCLISIFCACHFDTILSIQKSVSRERTEVSQIFTDECRTGDLRIFLSCLEC